MQSKQVVLIIGGNLYDRMALIDQCRKLLADFLGPASKASAVYESEAWGGKSSGNYLNQVLAFDTELSAMEILEGIQSIEQQLGRSREEKWGNRTMDIDILAFGEEVIETDLLSIPHPFLHLRRFVLVPLAEILPNWIHPLLRKSASELLEECPDISQVWKLK
ncbi:2-amino-4-hydroxy-6-hydroxymethyldihydropteridine diphosphokinase [Mariniradius sediminis]|uniref:2-amino-4-hydroxy-6-hydroxymethyldihydropteridine pyrophosphokinase n=1 Tax=Mariniradius sediminis TaxID=2909237 RepID=A0ABS9BVY1_9BACT|nr:2-amino-4-hydroxy-6-hydroxymethyldihydropteridine diphosphokinase [Mariniradius sediminis]MCF1752229.1 2-amino-4-hydroxy-6-hydroxymethyldihydropteridine diphosphokinase [Mariniradius sediminis]